MFLFDHREFAYIEAAMPGVLALVMQEAEGILNLGSINWNASGAMELFHFKLIALTIPLLLMAMGGDGLEHRPDLSGGMDEGGGPCSFTPQTHVATEHGEKPISTLHTGDKVWAYNLKTHKMEREPILHVWMHTDTDLVDLTITVVVKSQHLNASGQKSEVIHTNRKHPFFTIEQGFLPVAKIVIGMHILRGDGSSGVITAWKIVPGSKVMYNLEVVDDHTFTVGDGQWVVHNCGSLDVGAQREAYAIDNLDTLVPNAGDIVGTRTDVITGVGHTDADIETTNGIFEVAGPGHISSPKAISQFNTKMQQLQLLSLQDGRGLYILYDTSAGPVSAAMEKIANRWGATIVPFSLP